MKVLAKDLQRALKRLERVVETKKTLPVLRHVRVRLDGDHLALEATDLEAYLVTRIPVEEAGPIDTLVPLAEAKAAAAVAIDATGVIPLGQVPGQAFKVGPVTMAALPVEEFPAVPGEECAEVGTAAEAPLLEALKAVAPAVCADESRLVLRTIAWEVREGTFAATDGHRLHVVEAPIEVAEAYKESLPKGIVEVLLPARPAHALIGCLGKESVRFGLSGDRKVLRAAGPDYTLWIRPVDATFPNWRQVVPREGEAVALDRRALLDAAAKALKVYRSSWSVTPGLVLTEHGAVLDAVLDRGTDHVPVPCGRVPVREGKLRGRESLGVNARYLVDALMPMKAEVVQLRFRDPLSPLRLWGEGVAFQAIVMPMRLDGKGYRILDDESVLVIAPPRPAKKRQPEPEEPEEAPPNDPAVEPEDLMEGEPADEEPAPPEEGEPMEPHAEQEPVQTPEVPVEQAPPAEEAQEPATALPSPPEEAAEANQGAPNDSPGPSSEASPSPPPAADFPPLEDLLVPAAHAIGRQVVIEATAFEIQEVSVRLKGPDGVKSYGVRGFLKRLEAAA